MLGQAEACSVSTESPMTQSIGNLDRSLKQAEEILAHLFNRLKQVRNEKPIPAGLDKSTPMPPKASLTCAIDGFTSRVQAIHAAAEIVMSELDI